METSSLPPLISKESPDDTKDEIMSTVSNEPSQEVKPDDCKSDEQMLESKPTIPQSSSVDKQCLFQQEQEQQDAALIQSIYDHLVTSMCIEVACGMHRLAKTGMYPLSDLMQTHKKARKGFEYVNINGNSSVHGTKIAEHGSSDIVSNTIDASSINAASILDVVDEAPDTNTSSSIISTRKTNKDRVDIWGNIPQKEPVKKSVDCPICGRSVSAIRFAPHLDKCLGLGSRSGYSSNGLSKRTSSK